MRNAMICVDMDGVLADFQGGLERACKQENPYLAYNGTQMKWNTHEYWDFNEDEMWRRVRKFGGEFWSGLQKLPEADALVRKVEEAVGEENVAILTSPPRDPVALVGKVEWLKKYYPHLERRVILTPAKQFVAAPGRMLVDDYDVNIRRWKAQGGFAVTWAQAHNNAHNRMASRLADLDIELEEFLAT